MNKIISVIGLLILVLVTGACGSSERTAALKGTWAATQYDTEEGERVQIDILLKLDDADMAGFLGIDTSTAELGKFFTCRLPLTWSASDTQLILQPDVSKAVMEFTPEFRKMASDAGEGVDLDALEREMRSEMEEVMASIASEKIVSLDRNTLVLDEDDTTLILKRVE